MSIWTNLQLGVGARKISTYYLLKMMADQSGLPFRCRIFELDLSDDTIGFQGEHWSWPSHYC
jgi:hypothetical protein